MQKISSYLRSYGNEKVKSLEKRKVRSHNKVRYSARTFRQE